MNQAEGDHREAEGDHPGKSVGAEGVGLEAHGWDKWSKPMDPMAAAFEAPVAFQQFAPRTLGTSAGPSSNALWPRGQDLPDGALTGRRRTLKKADGSGNRKFGSEMSARNAGALARRARKEKLEIEFDQKHSKAGMSGERYERYKSLKKMNNILKAETEPYTYTKGVNKGRTETVMLRDGSRDDLKFDLQKGVALVRDGHGGFLTAAVLAATAPQRKALKMVRACGALKVREDEFISEAREWVEQSGIDAAEGGANELPTWMAMAAKMNVHVMADGMIEPANIKEAMRMPEWAAWQRSIEKEVAGLVEMGTWEEVDISVPRSRGKTILPCKIVLKIKTHQNEFGEMVVTKCKARAVAGGPARALERTSGRRRRTRRARRPFARFWRWRPRTTTRW